MAEIAQGGPDNGQPHAEQAQKVGGLATPPERTIDATESFEPDSPIPKHGSRGASLEPESGELEDDGGNAGLIEGEELKKYESFEYIDLEPGQLSLNPGHTKALEDLLDQVDQAIRSVFFSNPKNFQRILIQDSETNEPETAVIVNGQALVNMLKALSSEKPEIVNEILDCFIQEVRNLSPVHNLLARLNGTRNEEFAGFLRRNIRRTYQMICAVRDLFKKLKEEGVNTDLNVPPHQYNNQDYLPSQLVELFYNLNTSNGDPARCGQIEEIIYQLRLRQ
ncbi:MAG: hypothetical protein N2691_02320 [Patescibacteria group bacterium]|nr:hypothetical protein [Patescibacteria group bacterium]